jgi:hypothetical protein
MHKVNIRILLELLLKLPCEVDQINWVHQGSSIELAVTIDVRALQELLVKQHNNLFLRLANHSAAETKRNVFPPHRVDIHYTAADLKVIDLHIVEERRPVWEALNKDLSWLQEFKLARQQIALSVVLLHLLTLPVETFNDLRAQSIETHVDEGQVGHWLSIDPLKDQLQLCFGLLGLTAVQVL